MSAKQLFLMFFGISAGGVIAAGVYAFMVMIGVYTRLIGKTRTKHHIFLYDMMIVTGGVLGNVLDIYKWQIASLAGNAGFVGNTGFAVGLLWVKQAVIWLGLGLFGLACGVFVGCLVMSLAETLKALPVISRRIRLAVGLEYVILSIALGKVTGSLIYFMRNVGGN